MANNVAKVNGIAIADIAKINGQNDSDLVKLNGEEFTAAYSGITWSTDDVLPAALVHGIKMGLAGAVGILDGADSKATYEHDGSSWSTTGSSSSLHSVGGGGGTQGAGVVFNGYGTSDESNVTEEYNGSTWSTGNNTVQGSAYNSGGGTAQTAQLCTGGSSYSPTVRNLSMTQTYNGTNWTNESVASHGIGTAAQGESGGGGLDAYFIGAGSREDPPNNNQSLIAQIFNQSAGSWTSKTVASTSAIYIGSSTDGTRVYKMGGYNAPSWTQTTVVESWVDNTWTTENSLPSARRGGGAGTGGLEATGGASNIGGADASGTTTSYFIAVAS